MSNIRQSDAHPIALAWPLIADDLARIVEKRRQLSPPRQRPAYPAIHDRVAALSVGGRLPIYGNPRHIITRANALTSGEFRSEAKGDLLWIVERVR